MALNNPIASRFRTTQTTDASVMRDQIAELYDMVKRLDRIVPVGTVILTHLPRNPAPDYYLELDGRSVSVGDYPALAAACPFMVSSSDPTVLTLPDERERFPVFHSYDSQPGQRSTIALAAGVDVALKRSFMTPFIRAR